MSDIVERLRDWASNSTGCNPSNAPCTEAADEIERLRARIADWERREQQIALAYQSSQKMAVERYDMKPGDLQWAWRQGQRTDRREIEWAIVDALAMGCVVAYPGDGVGCAAQIVTAQMDRAEAATARAAALEAANAAMTKASSALIDFHNGPVEEKRPDIHQRLLQRLANALRDPHTNNTIGDAR